MRKFNQIHAALVAAAFASSAAIAAEPAPFVKLHGGGATLPANAYVGHSWLAYSPAERLSDTQPTDLGFLNPDATGTFDSLFGQMLVDKKNPAYVSYCQTGSTGGRKVLLGTMSAGGAAEACGDYSVTPTGFSNGVTVASYDADFVGSDAPLSASDVSTFVTNKGATKGAPVQFPAVVGAVAPVYNNADATTQLNLTESQLCQVFSGAITNWSDLGLPTKPITVVYRSDGSGTTFSFLNHLSAVCPTAQPTAVTGFTTQSSFVTGAVGGAAPAGAVGASGNGGVVNAVLATDGAIGYAEVSDAKARQSLAGGSALKWSTVSKRPDIAKGVDPVTGLKIKAVKYKKWDPVAKLPKAVKLTTVSDKVIGANDVDGRPVLVDAYGVDPVTLLPNPPNVPAAAGCIQLVDPNSYAIPALKKDDYTMFPIIAVSYLMGYYQGNDPAKLTALENMMVLPYKITGKVKTIGKANGGTGFAGVAIKELNPAGLAKAAPGTKMANLVRACLN